MKMPIGQVPAVVAEYFDNVLIPAAAKAGGIMPFTVGMASVIAQRNAAGIVDKYLPTLKAIGLVDSDNRLDVDTAYDAAVKSFEKNPVTIAGYRPAKEDFDAVKAIMQKYGG